MVIQCDFTVSLGCTDSPFRNKRETIVYHWSSFSNECETTAYNPPTYGANHSLNCNGCSNCPELVSNGFTFVSPITQGLNERRVATFTSIRDES